jgi:hypothetical protein
LQILENLIPNLKKAQDLTLTVSGRLAHAKYLSLKIKKSPFSRLRKGKVRLTLLQPATENSKEGKAKQRTEIEGLYSIFLDICKNTEYCQL